MIYLVDGGRVADGGLAVRTGSDPRVERTRAHVLAHARRLLSVEGPAGVTYSELAASAKVTRQTLYRHWPTREQLFVDLVLERALAQIPDEPGSAEHVITLFLYRLRDGMNDLSNASALTALIAQADHDPTSHTALESVVTRVRAALNDVLCSRGVSLDADQYAGLCGPVLFQRFVARHPVSDQFIDALVAHWWQTR